MTDKTARLAWDKTQAVHRTFGVKVLQTRAGTGAAADIVTLSGYACTTEQPYEMWDPWGSYTEIVEHGAFAVTLAQAPKVQLLVNHGGLSLAQTTSDSLRLVEDDTGLLMEADINTARADAADLAHAVRDGAVDEMSFAFRIVRQQWSPDYEEVRIKEINLNRGDVSVVNLGANPATSIAVRSADLNRWLEHLDRATAAELIARLTARQNDDQGQGMSLAAARALAAL